MGRMDWRLRSGIAVFLLLGCIGMEAWLGWAWKKIGSLHWMAGAAWPLLFWVITAVLMALFFLTLGWAYKGAWRGLLVSNRNTMSLARTQLFLWNIIGLSAFLALWVAVVHTDKDTGHWVVGFPGDLLALMGLSIGTATGSSIILGVKNSASATVKDLDDKFMSYLGKYWDRYLGDFVDKLEGAANPASRETMLKALRNDALQEAVKLHPLSSIPPVLQGTLSDALVKKIANLGRSDIKPVLAKAKVAWHEDLRDPAGSARFTDAALQVPSVVVNNATTAVAKVGNPALGKDEQLLLIMLFAEYTRQALDATLNKGLLARNLDPQEARFADLLEGDEVGNGDGFDFGKVQLFVITLIVMAGYIAVLVQMFVRPPDPWPAQLPGFSGGLVQVLLFSQVGYLGFKGASHTATI